jgi:hypothetical protein
MAVGAYYSDMDNVKTSGLVELYDQGIQTLAHCVRWSKAPTEVRDRYKKLATNMLEDALKSTGL